MSTTTHSEFGHDTEALEVAAAFPDRIKGKTAIVTGANRDGIGFTTSEALASQSPARLILTGRSIAKIESCISALKEKYPSVDYRPLVVDLSSQASVRAAAEKVLSWNDVPTIDIIINSAGVMNLPKRVLSPEGIEMTFATNHIGHYLLTNLLLPKLIKAGEGKPKGSVRIVNVSSLSPTFGQIRWSDINFDKINDTLPQEEQPVYDIHRAWGFGDGEKISFLPLEAYNQSKVANLLFSIGANKRLYEKYGILSLTCHPGVIQTELGRNMSPESLKSIEHMVAAQTFKMKTLGAGSSTSLVSALDPKLTLPGVGSPSGKENYGTYLVDCQISDIAKPLTTSSSEAEKMWALSEELVKQKFTW